MKRVEAPCPSCGGIIEFQVSSSLVTVCDYCQTVVARGDRKLEDHGKVAAIAPTGTKLQLGMEGHYRNKSFEIVGHVQYDHAGGGVWDEWYASFPGDRWAWFSEAQGKIYFLRERKLKQPEDVPGYEELAVGGELNVQGIERLVVAEKGTAAVRGAEGELPFIVEPGKSHRYADLAGKEQAFATIEYDESGQRVLNLGREVTLADLDLAPFDGALDAEILEVSSIKVDCPNCGGSLDLHAPDQTERVICPFCEGVLDASHGKLKYLHTLENKQSSGPVIPIGSKGNLKGNDYIVIGFMRRSVTYDRDYFWSEYLLYNPELGFRWLVHSDDHWSFVESVSLADVQHSTYSQYASYQGRRYRLFQRAEATVRYVLGEFYWMVAVGEKVQALDYVCPPAMISIEKTVLGRQNSSGSSEEITCSLGTYLPHEELEAAFKLKPLRRGWGVAPNQPQPYEIAPIWLSWLGFVVLLCFLNMISWAGLSLGTPDTGWFWAAAIVLTLVPIGTLLHRSSFEKQRWQESDFSPYSSD